MDAARARGKGGTPPPREKPPPFWRPRPGRRNVALQSRAATGKLRRRGRRGHSDRRSRRAPPGARRVHRRHPPRRLLRSGELARPPHDHPRGRAPPPQRPAPHPQRYVALPTARPGAGAGTPPPRPSRAPNAAGTKGTSGGRRPSGSADGVPAPAPRTPPIRRSATPRRRRQEVRQVAARPHRPARRALLEERPHALARVGLRAAPPEGARVEVVGAREVGFARGPYPHPGGADRG